jgi:Protein of unknown function (DUF4236)
MGFKFQKRIKLMPGITFNLSKKGVSTSFGKTGARITLGHGQTRITTGLPGSGISHTSISADKKSNANFQSEKFDFLELPVDTPTSRQRAGQLLSQMIKGLFRGLFGR